MIGRIREAFIELLDENHWMDPPTRQVARHKALQMNERIGYPDFLTKVTELNKEFHPVRHPSPPHIIPLKYSQIKNIYSQFSSSPFPASIFYGTF
jgi:hypothetical protein